jgi:hypothetical protein
MQIPRKMEIDGGANVNVEEDEVIPISAQDVFSEICCDWPLVSASEVNALAAVLPPTTVSMNV